MTSYVARKQSQLSKLGFDSGRYRTQLTMTLDNERDLVDAFLGIKKEVRIADVKTFEDRFGISLPIEPTSQFGGKVTFEPHPADKCTIIYRRHRTGRALSFDGDVVFAPRLIMQDGNIAALIRTEFFQIRYGDSKLEFLGAQDIFTAHRSSAQNWRKYFHFCADLSASGGEIEIIPKNATVALRVPLETKRLNGIDPEFYTYYASMADFLQEILEVAGCENSLSISFHELSRNSQLIRLVHALRSDSGNKAGILNFTTDCPVGASNIPTLNIIAYVITISIGGVNIVFSAKVEMNASKVDDSILWSSTNITTFELRQLRDVPGEGERYAGEVQSEMGAMGIVAHSLEPNGAIGD
jgi:hypothetical protein